MKSIVHTRLILNFISPTHTHARGSLDRWIVTWLELFFLLNLDDEMKVHNRVFTTLNLKRSFRFIILTSGIWLMQ